MEKEPQSLVNLRTKSVNVTHWPMNHFGVGASFASRAAAKPMSTEENAERSKPCIQVDYFFGECGGKVAVMKRVNELC